MATKQTPKRKICSIITSKTFPALTNPRQETSTRCTSYYTICYISQFATPILQLVLSSLHPPPESATHALTSSHGVPARAVSDATLEALVSAGTRLAVGARHRRVVRRVRLGQVTKRRVVGTGRVLTRARASALVVGVVGDEIAAVQVRRHDERVRHDPANHQQRLRRFLPTHQKHSLKVS